MGPVRPLADRPRLRLFLRLPRRRDLAVGAAPVRKPQSRRAAARRDISSQRGPCGQGRRLAAQAPRLFAGQALLPVLGTGAGHGPHHIFKEWADKYKGKFDDGWDAYRERVFKRQKEMGWIPADTKLTPRDKTMPGWDSMPESERPFQRRLMEVFAGFVEHVDAQAGKVIDELDRLGVRDNTIVYLYLRRQRGERRGPERQHQRTARAERHPEHDRQQTRGPRRTWRARRARRSEDGQHVSRRLGVGRQHAVSSHQTRRLALRRHAQPDGDFVAQRHQAGQTPRAASSCTSTTSRRRSTTSSASSSRRWSTASSRTPSMA